MVSVIIPTFNRANTIDKSIKSVIDQGELIKEILIIDDNSNDNTEEIVKNIDSNKIKYYKSDKSIGACAARNIGIEKSNSDFIAFHDSDDIWHIDKLKKQFNYMVNSDVDIVCSGYNQIMNGNKIYIGKNISDNEIHKELLNENFIGTPTIMGKAECFKKNKFDTELPRFQDWELMIRLSKIYKVGFIDEPLVDAFVQKNSITMNKKNATKALNLILNKNIDELIERPKIIEKYYRRMGVFALHSDEKYINYFYDAFKTNKSIKSTVDYLLSVMRLKQVLKFIHKN